MTDQNVAAGAPRSAIARLSEQWRQRAKDDIRYGVSKSRVTGSDLKSANREYFGTVNAAFAFAECADELDAALRACAEARPSTTERYVDTETGETWEFVKQEISPIDGKVWIHLRQPEAVSYRKRQVSEPVLRKNFARAEALAPPPANRRRQSGYARRQPVTIRTTGSTASQNEVASAPAPNLTFAQFSAVNRQRCQSPEGFSHPLNSWSTSDWFLATLGELGEAANNAKKLNRYRDGIPGNKESEAELRDKLRKELGDVYVYLDLLAQSLGIDIGAAAVEVFNAKSDEIGCPIRIEAKHDAPSIQKVEESDDGVEDRVRELLDDAESAFNAGGVAVTMMMDAEIATYLRSLLPALPVEDTRRCSYCGGTEFDRVQELFGGGWRTRCTGCQRTGTAV